MGALFGLATKKNAADSSKAILVIAQEIKTLHLNEETIVDAINDVRWIAITFEKRNSMNIEAIALYTMERDLIENVRLIFTVLQLMIHKYAQIMLATIGGSTSPFALTTSEI